MCCALVDARADGELIGALTPIVAANLGLQATDADAGAFSNVTYAIEDVDGLPLEIDVITGVVTLSADTDFEAGATEFEFTIVASDQGDPALEAEQTLTLAVLDVNDHAPEIAEVNSTTTVLRDAAVGTVVWTFEDVTDVTPLPKKNVRRSFGAASCTSFAMP